MPPGGKPQTELLATCYRERTEETGSPRAETHPHPVPCCRVSPTPGGGEQITPTGAPTYGNPRTQRLRGEGPTGRILGRGGCGRHLPGKPTNGAVGGSLLGREHACTHLIHNVVQ